MMEDREDMGEFEEKAAVESEMKQVRTREPSRKGGTRTKVIAEANGPIKLE